MKNNKGFSLIELLVVISIIGILTTVLVMNFVGSRQRARDAQTIQNLNSIKNALRMYYNEYQFYPDNINVLVPTYIPGLGGITNEGYALLSSGDGFRFQKTLEVGAGDEDINSQQNCGVDLGERIYVVCAN